jgi:hypothetical protein
MGEHNGRHNARHNGRRNSGRNNARSLDLDQERTYGRAVGPRPVGASGSVGARGWYESTWARS